MERFAEIGRGILDASLYMTLATADESGRPWASPVYYALASYDELLWVSLPSATHSLNIAARPDVGVVVFDSTAAIGAAAGVYMRAAGSEVAAGELERCLDAYSRRSVAHGGKAWSRDDVTAPGGLRLYHALVSEHSVLAVRERGRDERVPVRL